MNIRVKNQILNALGGQRNLLLILVFAFLRVFTEFILVELIIKGWRFLGNCGCFGCSLSFPFNLVPEIFSVLCFYLISKNILGFKKWSSLLWACVFVFFFMLSSFFQFAGAGIFHLFPFESILNYLNYGLFDFIGMLFSLFIFSISLSLFSKYKTWFRKKEKLKHLGSVVLLLAVVFWSIEKFLDSSFFLFKIELSQIIFPIGLILWVLGFMKMSNSKNLKSKTKELNDSE